MWDRCEIGLLLAGWMLFWAFNNLLHWGVFDVGGFVCVLYLWGVALVNACLWLFY